MLGTFSTDNLREPFMTKALDAKDVEMPRLLRRPGGYWLSWVRSLPEPKKPTVSASGGRSQQDPEERELLEVGLRVVEVAKLEKRENRRHGVRVGQPRRQVLLTHVAPLGAGARRDRWTALRRAGGWRVLSQVGPEAAARRASRDDEIGAAPALMGRGSELPAPARRQADERRARIG